MGRRKIEIQPITHERNRSVTFLKRKNGLFKKAYELGVLCSVDVAVIIFEERPGHHVKLYQYGSSDIHDIVQKHLRHDGEKDTRGPSDFSGNANPTKLGEGGDDDDDEDIDDDDIPSRSNKRRIDGKLKPDMVPGGMDYAGHRIPQPPSLSLHPNQSGSGASLPISNDRGMPRGGGGDFNKRSSNRLALGHSRSPSDNPNDPNSGPYAYGGSFGGRSNTHYGHPHHGHGGGPHHQPHHSGSSAPYQPFFPHPSPPPSFMPLQADFPRGSVSGRGAPGGPGGPGGGAGGFGLGPARSSSGSSTYDNPNIYPNNSLLRGGPPGSGAPNAGGPGGGSGAGNPDLFAAFLDADEQSRAAAAAHSGQGAQSTGGFVGLDWPVHGGAGGGASGPPSGPPSSAANPPNPSSAGPDSGPGNNPNWLDFLSGNNPNSSGNPPGPRADSSMSWERGGGPGGNDHRGDIGDMFGAGDRGRTGSGLGGAKRKGEDDGPSGLASPASVNGGRDVKKDGG